MAFARDGIIPSWQIDANKLVSKSYLQLNRFPKRVLQTEL